MNMKTGDDLLYLAKFLKYMGIDKNMIDKRLENRIKGQKFVFFGKKFGLPLTYDFDIYLYGPYSSELGRDYYDIPETKDIVSDLNENVKKKLAFLKSKDALYLEISATLDSIKTRNKNINDNDLIEMVSELKSNRLKEKHKKSDYINFVLKDLTKNNII